MRRCTTGLGVFLLLLVPSITLASIVNRTIDDSYGDSETLQRPLYLPATHVWNNQWCSGCAIKPDTAKAFNGTYTAATYMPKLQNISISMGFEGTAIYVYFILPNNQGDGVTTLTMANFTIDGQFAGNFTHIPDLTTTIILYNQMVFSKIDMPNGVHQLVISTSGLDFHAFINFDYAVYMHVEDDAISLSSPIYSTTQSTLRTSGSPLASSGSTTSDTSSVSSSKETAIFGIVGGTLGVAILIGVIIALILYQIRRRRKIQPNRQRATLMNHGMNKVSLLVPTPFLTGAFQNHADHSAPTETIDSSTGPRMRQHLFSQRPDSGAPRTQQSSSSFVLSASTTDSECVWPPSENDSQAQTQEGIAGLSRAI